MISDALSVRVYPISRAVGGTSVSLYVVGISVEADGCGISVSLYVVGISVEADGLSIASAGLKCVLSMALALNGKIPVALNDFL